MPINKDWPKTCQAAVGHILDRLDEASVKVLIETKFEDLINFNRLMGMRIRNNFGLWQGNHELMNSCLELRENASYDPDVVSLIIIEELWKELNIRQTDLSKPQESW